MPDADLTVRLQPRAKRNAITGERDGVLCVSVAAAPVEGQANAALCKLDCQARRGRSWPGQRDPGRALP